LGAPGTNNNTSKRVLDLLKFVFKYVPCFGNSSKKQTASKSAYK